MTRLMIVGGAAVAVLMGATSSQASLLLDVFDADSVSEVVNLHVPTAALSNSDSVTVTDDLIPGPHDPFGSERYVEISRTSTGSVDALIDNGSGVLDFATSGSISGAMLTIMYDDFADVDVTQGGLNSAFILDSTFVEGMADVTLTLSDGVNSYSVTKTLASAGDLTFNLASFLGVDVTSIDKITIEAETMTPGTDIVFDTALFDVPEPGSLALLGAAGLLFAGRRRA